MNLNKTTNAHQIIIIQYNDINARCTIKKKPSDLLDTNDDMSLARFDPRFWILIGDGRAADKV